MTDFPQRVEVIEAIQSRVRSLAMPSWPLYGLVDQGVGWLCGASQDENDVVSCLRLDYRAPATAERVLVQTQPLVTPLVDLDALLAQVAEPTDDGEPLLLTSVDPVTGVLKTVTVDGNAATATFAYTATAAVWTVVANGVLVVVAARAVDLSGVEIRQVPDLAPAKDARTEIIKRLLGNDTRNG